MELTVIVAFAAAVVAGSIALGVALSARKVAHWLFVGGMVALAVESLMVGLSRYALLPERALLWQQWRILLLSIIPGAWLTFSTVYARDNASELLRRSQWVWIPA